MALYPGLFIFVAFCQAVNFPRGILSRAIWFVAFCPVAFCPVAFCPYTTSAVMVWVKTKYDVWRQ